jgi:hypothetical protein
MRLTILVNRVRPCRNIEVKYVLYCIKLSIDIKKQSHVFSIIVVIYICTVPVVHNGNINRNVMVKSYFTNWACDGSLRPNNINNFISNYYF